MTRKLTAIAAAASLALVAFGASSASAATEFGDNCVANRSSEVPVTYFALTAIGKTMPLASPTGGVITKWKTTLLSGAASIPQILKVLRLTGPNTVQVVGEQSGAITGGLNTIDTRIPIQAGDRLGLFGPSASGTLFCELPGPEDTFGAFLGSIGPGTTTAYVEVVDEAGIPVAAIVEPDADNDGYGDETQDKCPQLASFQTPCPVVTLTTSSEVKRGLVKVLVTSSLQVPVTVAGTVKLGKGKTAKLNGGTQVVAPGALATFKVLFPKKLKAKLKELSRKRSLQLNLSISAPNPLGTVTTNAVKAKVKGQKKPPRKKAKAKKG
jgi:hypothetical protein